MSKNSTQTVVLKEEVLELFVSGCASECSIKPIIMIELKEDKYKSEGRPTMRYPIDREYMLVI